MTRRALGPPVLITGGAGFIGTNLAHRLLSNRQPVVLLDNLARPGVGENLRWLSDTHGNLLEVEIADVGDTQVVRRAVERATQVFHFAAQVAVTTSLSSPLEDFEVNARGTLNLLEAIRARSSPPPLVFTSTNKVYGALDDVELRNSGRRYEPVDLALRRSGLSERRALDFHSPYGCSKGCADQYVLDYARTYGIPTTVFRMSCIYGPHQFGTEDQGWVAHFLIRAMEELPITIYGDGLQVRDILCVEDLVDAFLLAQERMLDLMAELLGARPDVELNDWRPGDQRYYVSDTSKFRRATGWRPRWSVRDGLELLIDWLRHSRGGPALMGSVAHAVTTARKAAGGSR
jgi:CDP-paratose 2-epimerase